MSQLSHAQTLDIIVEAQSARRLGNSEEYMRLIQQIPLAPHLAMVAKEIWGKEYLLQSGFDLTEADARYGKYWLNQ